MVKLFPLLFIYLLPAFHSTAQTASIDKNKVLEHFQNQEYEEAISYLQPAFVRDSINLQVLNFLGYANYFNDNPGAAERYYQKMFTIDSNNITAIRYLAAIHNNGRPELALNYTNRLIRLQPGKAAYYRNHAELLQRLNIKDSALYYYDKAYWLAPADYKNHAGLLTVLLDKKEYPRADSIINAGLLNDSLNIPYLKFRIRLAYEKKDYKNALIPGERLIALNEVSLNALTQLTLSYYYLNMYADCIRVSEYMLNNNLDVESIYYYQSRAWAKLKDFRKSNELLEICLKKAISETAEMYWYNLGQNYESLKQYKKAIAQYDSAYFLFKDPLMNYNIGGIYEVQLKDPAAAKRYYQKYLRLAKPQTAEEKKAYEYVRDKWRK